MDPLLRVGAIDIDDALERGAGRLHVALTEGSLARACVSVRIWLGIDRENAALQRRTASSFPSRLCCSDGGGFESVDLGQ